MGVGGGGKGRSEEGKEAVIFVTAIVFSNKETSSLVWRRCGYHAAYRAAVESESEGRGGERRGGNAP